MAASGKIRIKFVKLAKIQFQLFFTTLDIMGSLYIVTFNIKWKQFAVLYTEP